MRIKLDATEKKIIQRRDPAVRGRALLELEIVCALIRAVKSTDMYYELNGCCFINQDSQLKEALFDLDDALLYACKGTERIGWIRLTFGNDGYDLISDYTVNLGYVIKPALELADFWGDEF